MGSELNNSGAVGPMFLGGPRAVLFRQTEKFFRQTKHFSDKPKNFPDNNILNLLPPPPSSTTLTISDNIDNFPTGLNNRGGGMACPPPATSPLLNNVDYFCCDCFCLGTPPEVGISVYTRSSLISGNNTRIVFFASEGVKA
jgi:hypothetical protein